jgi:predicted AAA+ superfamily ATPase
LGLLAGAGLVTGLDKFSGSTIRQRGSSPKLQVLNTALASAESGLTFDEAREDRDLWGRLTESAVGAHLANAAATGICEVSYWRDRNREVDFVVRSGKTLVAIEVKSARRGSLSGMAAFADAFRPTRTLLVGGDGITLDEFLAMPVELLLKR